MLDIEGLRVAYGSEYVIDGLDWRAVDAAPVTAVLGPSGCGKSTLIRAIAGLEPVAGGHIRFDGHDLAGVPAHRRDFGVVFQDGQLFGGRSVGANIGYGLRIRRHSRPERIRRVQEMLDLVQLSGFEKRRVDELSGGQAQRVALARALAPAPRLLLLDEPLAALDRRLRDDLAVAIADIVRSREMPTIVVTHDHAEAAVMADVIAVMRDGRIVQSDPPARLWNHPADAWTARFLGCTNIIGAHRTSTGVITDIGPVAVEVPWAHGQLGLRAESVHAV
ncbi:MAG: ABC transporter ATP-binding protein, partial [Gordonia sp. (in: high G+C Gram-positive bacteria)]